MTYICITSIPSGNAPWHVRHAWLGLKVPLARTHSESQPRGDAGFYVVNADQALSVLRRSSLKAANWWHRNMPPVQNNEFLFAQRNCQLIRE